MCPFLEPAAPNNTLRDRMVRGLGQMAHSISEINEKVEKFQRKSPKNGTYSLSTIRFEHLF